MFSAFCVCSTQTHLDPFCGVSGWLTSSGSSNICSRSSFDSSRSANWSTFDAIFTELSFSTEFPIVSLNFNFSSRNAAFVVRKCFVNFLLLSEFQILMPKLLLWSPEILTDTSMMLCCVFCCCCCCFSFLYTMELFSFRLFFLNHFQGYLTRKIFFLWYILSEMFFSWNFDEKLFLVCLRWTEFWVWLTAWRGKPNLIHWFAFEFFTDRSRFYFWLRKDGK